MGHSLLEHLISINCVHARAHFAFAACHSGLLQPKHEQIGSVVVQFIGDGSAKELRSGTVDSLHEAMRFFARPPIAPPDAAVFADRRCSHAGLKIAMAKV
jgi:hypothetical protein